MSDKEREPFLSSFSVLFISGILWGFCWHFAAYIIDRAVSKPQWAYITKLTLGVVITYPFVEMMTVKVAKMCGADKETIDRLRVWVFAGYFGAFIPGGIGKGFGCVVDPKVH